MTQIAITCFLFGMGALAVIVCAISIDELLAKWIETRAELLELDRRAGE